MNKNFTLIHEEDLTYNKGKGIWVKHNKTGFEIFKFLCDKNENYFCFNFVTPSSDDTGVAHILEHSVLHGSKKYSDPELFFKLQQRSPAKIINAMTSKYYTSFYASSCVPKDFYNLLDIIGDSIFNPLLLPEVFKQEGWRLDLKDGKPFINGVVFNEMNTAGKKEAYINCQMKKKFMNGSEEVFFPGGYPLEIPNVKYEDLLNFHKKYYVPGNCLLTLVGNMDFDQQLDFLDKNLLSKLPENTKRIEIKDNVIPFTERQEFSFEVPVDSENNDYTVSLKILMKDGDSKEISFREDFLMLLQDALFTYISTPKVGTTGTADIIGSPDHKMFSISLFNVKKDEVEKAKEYILWSLNQILENGISKDTLNTFITGMDNLIEDDDFEVKGDSINEIVINSWIEINDVFECLEDPEKEWLENRKKLLDGDAEFYSNLLRGYIIDNPHQAFFIMKPVDDFFTKIDNEQAKLLHQLVEKTSIEEIEKNYEAFSRFNDEIEKNDNFDLYQELKISDLPMFQDAGLGELEFIEGKKGKVHLFSSALNIKKKTYVNISFPVDILEPEEYMYMYESIKLLNCIGINDSTLEDKIDLKINNAISEYKTFISCDTPVEFSKNENIYEGRWWYQISFGCFNSKMANAMKLIKDLIYSPNLSDNEDLDGYKKNFSNYISTNFHGCYTEFASEYVNLFPNDCMIADALFNGYSRVKRFKEFQQEKVETLIEKIISVYRKVVNSGAIINVISSSEFLPKAKEIITDFVIDTGIGPLPKELDNKHQLIRNYLKLEEFKKDEKEYFTVISNSSNLAAFANFKSSSYPSKEFAAEEALLVWLSNTALYDSIRKRNGAYDVGIFNCSQSGDIRFYTYRDSDPKVSIQLFEEVLENLSKMKFDEETVKNIIIRSYANAMGDIEELEKGKIRYVRLLAGITPEHREKRIKNMLSLTPKDFEDTAKRIYEFSKKMKVCICTNDEKKSLGKIVIREV